MATTRTNARLLNLLGFELGVDKDTTTQNTVRYPTEVRQEHIDEARREIQYRRDLRFFEATDTISATEGDHDHDLPSDWLRPYYAYYLDGNGDKCDLNFITYAEWDDLYADHTSSDYAAPDHIAVYGTEYFLGPKPDASYTIYVRYFKQLADGQDDDLLTFGWEAVKELAKVYGRRYLEHPEPSILSQERYAEKKLNIFAGSENRARWSARPLQAKTTKG
jgi:hypothetical protein